MSKTLIRDREAREEAWTGERCFITELMNDPAIPEVSLAQCRVPPGTTTQCHRLSVTEWHVVGQGNGLSQVGADAPFEIGCGDKVVVPANTPQRVTNTGDVDLIFYCICVPRFTPDCYQPIEDD